MATAAAYGLAMAAKVTGHVWTFSELFNAVMPAKQIAG